MVWTKQNRKKYYQENKEKFFQYGKRYRNTHKKQIYIINKIYKEKNREKLKKQYKNWRNKNLERLKQKQREYYIKVKKPNRKNENKRLRELHKKQREIVINHYGNKCNCCGEKIMQFLTIDHINNNGAKHRKEIGGSNKIYSWIIKNSFPEGFQILCFNCNLGKSINNGICPHHIKIQLKGGSR